MDEFDYVKWHIKWNMNIKYDTPSPSITEINDIEKENKWNLKWELDNKDVKTDTEIQDNDVHFTNLFDYYAIKTKPEVEKELQIDYSSNDAYKDRMVELPPIEYSNEKCVNTLHNLNHNKNIVLFGLSKCSHCNKMNELIQNNIENKWANIVEQNDVSYVHNFMDIDKCYKTAEFYNIENVPYILLLKGKNIVKIIEPTVYKTNKSRLMQIEKFLISDN